MDVLLNEEIPVSSWCELLSLNPYASPFQTPEFYNLFNSVSGLSADVFAILGDDSLQALVVVTIQKEKGLKSFFSKRGIIYGGPLIKDNNHEALSLLLKVIIKHYKRELIYIQTRNFFNYSPYKNVYENNGWVYESYLNFQLDCIKHEIIWNNLNRNRKRQIKKATSIGVKITEASSEEEVRSFYTLLINLYRNKVHKPLFPWEFFKSVYDNYPSGKFYMVKSPENKIIGGSFCLLYTKEKIYNWYGCGLDKEYPDLSPTVMATYAILIYGADKGYKSFDFMGAGKPDADYGVRDFKEKFGGTLVENGRFIKTLNPFLFHIGKFGLWTLSLIRNENNY